MNERRNRSTACELEALPDHLASCKAENEKCRNCGITGQFARLCRKPRSGNFRETGRNKNRAGMRRANLIGRQRKPIRNNQWDEGVNQVLHVNGSGNQPIVMKGKINKEPFTAMVESSSPITIFTQADFRKVLKVECFPAYAQQ